MKILILFGYLLIYWGIFILLLGLCIFIYKLYKYKKYNNFILYDKPLTNNHLWYNFEYPIYILKYNYPSHKTCFLKVDLSDKDKYVPSYFNTETKQIIYYKIEKYFNLISPLILDKINNINQKYNDNFYNHIKKALLLHCFHVSKKYNLSFNDLLNNIDNIFNHINLNHFSIFYMFNFSNILYNPFWSIPLHNDGWDIIFSNL